MTLKKNQLLVTGWLMWLLSATFYSLDYFQHTAPSVLIGPIALSLHVSFIQIGNIMSIYFPIYAISQIAAGYLLDRFPLRYVLSSGCLVVSIGLFLMVTHSLSLLAIGRALIAIGSAFAFLGSLKVASLWLPTAFFPLAVGATNTLGVVGGLLGQPFLNALIEHFGWHTAIYTIFVFGMILSLLLLIFMFQPLRKSFHPELEAQKNLPEAKSCNYTYHECLKHNKWQVFKDYRIWLLTIYAGIMVGAVVNAFSELYDVVFLEHTFQISARTASSISSMLFIGIGLGGPVHGLIVKTFSSNERLKRIRQWMVICCLVTISLFALIILSGFVGVKLELLFILYFLTGFFVSSMLLAFTLVRLTYNEIHHGAIFAFINIGIGLFGAFFQSALSWIWKIIEVFYNSLSTSYLFLFSFLFLLIPLFISLICCYLVKFSKN